MFGCLLVDGNLSANEPNEGNGYCLTISPESAQEKELVLSVPEHVSLAKGEYPVPEAVIDKIAGGKFADSLGKLQVGDNYAKEATVIIEDIPKHTQTVMVRYGDEILLEQPERDGYSFEGWEYPRGTAVESKMGFIGGELPEGNITAQWSFVLSENLYVIWGSSLVLAVAAGFVIFVLKRRKNKATVDIAPVVKDVPEEATVLPSDWIERVCEKPEMSGLISKREMEVLKKLLEGKSRKQISDELFVTEATIKKHSASIYSKLDVHSRTELIYKLTKQ